MKFRCNLCLADQGSANYSVIGLTWDDGMLAMQHHMATFHDGDAIVEDVSINVRTRHA